MHIDSIVKVKDKLETLKEAGAIEAWELPYENILTRLDAAHFFVTLPDTNTDPVTKSFEDYDTFKLEKNDAQKLSTLDYQITFAASED